MKQESYDFIVSEFDKILESIVIPASIPIAEQNEAMLPLNDFLSNCFPQKLYKYRQCCENHISAFYKDQVWVASPQCMNDGFDTRMYFDKKEVLNNVLRKTNNDSFDSFIQSVKYYPFLQKMISQLLGNYDTINFENIGYIRDQLLSRINTLMDYLPNVSQQALRICCFSKTVNSPSMWGHYSENETGFCLEYSFENTSFKSQSITGDYRLCNIYPVVYKTEKFRVDSSFIEFLLQKRVFNEIEQAGNAEERSLLNVLQNNCLSCPDLLMASKIALNKSNEWEYEREWRLFCNSNDDTFQNENSGHFIRKATAIYLGRRISEVNEKILTGLGIEKGIPVYKMKLNDTSASYDLDLSEMSRPQN